MKLELSTHIANYLNQPGVLWDVALTEHLVSTKIEDISLIYSEGYSLTSCLSDKYDKKEISHPIPENKIRMVEPSAELNYFYEEHGLEILQIDDPSQIGLKISKSFAMIEMVTSIKDFVQCIVKSVQILKADDPETDVSYSHPKIPFSIFFSICEEVSEISDLRIAESILHESMHLLLTLIEEVVPMINSGSTAVYYSPWRQEERPVRGVLHGAFVFKAISDFYNLLALKINNNITREYITKRQHQISNELYAIKDFYSSSGLTEKGKHLSVKLLQ